HAGRRKYMTQTYEEWCKLPEAIAEWERSEIGGSKKPIEVLEKYKAIRQALGTAGTRGYWMKKREFDKPEGMNLPGERSYYLAKFHAHLGEKGQALDSLEQAWTEHHDMILLRVEPCG